MQQWRLTWGLAIAALMCPVVYSCAVPEESDQYGDPSLDPPKGGDGGGGSDSEGGATSTVNTQSADVVTVTLGSSNTTTTSDTATDTESSTVASSTESSTVSTVTTTDTTTTSTTTATATTDGGGGTGGADACPNDPNKTDPGQCGCDMPDTDSDGDQTADCNDGCPDDPDKTDPGSCGCGNADDANCTALANALIHRYSFDDTGTTVTDSVGNANGTLMGGSQSGGIVTFSGSNYVELPGGLISSLSAATLEVWYSWSGGSAWQRIFDFGVSDAGAGSQGMGESYVFLTPQAIDSSGYLRAAFTISGGNSNEVYADAAAASQTNTTVHVTVTMSANTLALYRGGNFETSAAMPGSLSSLQDDSNWLGRSQFSQDPGFSGNIREFRIYNAALTAGQVQASDSLGPDAPLGG